MQHEIKKFEEVTNLVDALHIKDIKNPEHQSYIFKTQTYELLIVRFVELDDDGLKGVSTPYLITKDGIFRYNRALDNFSKLKNHLELLNSITKHLQHCEWLVKKYIEETDTLEDGLYTRKIPSIFLDVWFDLKKDLTRVDRIFERVEEVLIDYNDIYRQNTNFPHDDFSNIIEHIRRYQKLANLNAAKLDTLYSYYNSLKNDKINNNIYILTVLSGIFLPLNLVVGFFGMNTENLFFAGDQNGTLNVVSILIGMFITLLVLFPIAKFIERALLQKVLGRFSLYNKLVKNIKKNNKFW
ncbi:MAG: hypothetical protein JXQ66_00905 [Campylobacterales bacterium]|nr:hypothetical protein [Campylobacterales bacterium]